MLRNYRSMDMQCRSRSVIVVSLLAFSLCTITSVSTAQGPAKRTSVTRALAPPDIDGLLMPGEWDDATVISDLHQVSPVEFSAPSEKTTFYVTYDENALYVAAIAYDDEPDQITARTLRQGGSLNADDTVTVLIDAFNNKRSGYSFSVNPYGVREDGIFTSGTRLSDDWDGIWRSAASSSANGWTAEMAIPFNTLTFSPENDTWGFNVSRELRRRNEEIAWNSRNGRVNPTVSGELQGFEGITQGRGLDIIPAVSSTYQRQYIDDHSESDVRPSLDINYKLTPAINLLLTLNTDFAATEVDGRQLDVSRFSLFFPEKRSFFLTDFDIFQFGGISTGGGGRGSIPGAESGTNALPFYSRRIGLGTSREPVDLIGGLKLSGRIGDADFGTLYVRQDEFADVEASDLFIARLTHGVLTESSVGAIETVGDPTSNESSSLVGVDFNYRNTGLPDNRTLEGWAWVQKSDNPGLDTDDVAWSLSLGMPAQVGWEFGGQVHEVQQNFQPRLGFANRTGVRLLSGRISRRWINDDSYWFQRYSPRIDFHRWQYLGSDQMQSEEIRVNPIDFRTAANDNLRVGISRQAERLLEGENPLDRLGINLLPGEYEFDRWDVDLGTGSHRPISVDLRLDGGDYYSGERFGVSPGIEWRINNHVAFELEYEYNKYSFSDAEATTRQVMLQNEIAFDSHWSLVTLVQFDNLSNDIGTNMRLHYYRAAGQDFWLVFNHNMREFAPDDPEFRSSNFRNTESLVALKFRYTFRM